MNSNSTRAMVETAYNEWIAASHALWDARMALSPELYKLDLEHNRRVAKLREARHVAAQELAASRGWHLTNRRLRPLPLKYPVVDHAEFFLTSDGEPAAVLTHSYAPWLAIRRFASEHGLAVERLDWSWHYPGGCIAALFTGALI
ncbi:MAG: hypothetical protein WB760_01020 [Xanthobacteraceae bacterium]